MEHVSYPSKYQNFTLTKGYVLAQFQYNDYRKTLTLKFIPTQEFQ